MLIFTPCVWDFERLYYSVGLVFQMLTIQYNLYSVTMFIFDPLNVH